MCIFLGNKHSTYDLFIHCWEEIPFFKKACELSIEVIHL